MKKTTKIVTIMLLIVAILMGMTTICRAEEINPAELAGQLKPTVTDSEAQHDLTDIGNQIIGIITTVGVVVAVIVLLILGIKYMMASVPEKAEYKKTMIPYLVGAVLIFGASAITKVIVNLASLSK